MAAYIITAEEKHRIMEGLTEFNGSINAMGNSLGYQKEKIYKIVHRDPDLRRHWVTLKNSHAPGGMHTMPMVIPKPLTPEAEAASRLNLANERFKSDLNAIGMVHEVSEMAVALENFHKKHGMSMPDMVQVAIGKMFFTVQMLLEKGLKDLSALDLSQPDNQTIAAGLRTHIENLINLSLKTNDSLNQGLIARARVKMIQDSAAKGGRGKPERTLAIQAQAGSTVNVGVEGEQVEQAEPSAPVDG